MDLLIEKLDGSRYYLSQYKVLITEFEESAPSVTRNSKQLDQRNGNIDFGGWHTDKTINITGCYRADDIDEEETLREKLYALLSDPNGYYITQLKTSPDMAVERPGETSGNYYDKLNDYPSHKRFLVYTESPEVELVGNVNGTLLYKLTAEFKTLKLPYGETPAIDIGIDTPYKDVPVNLLTGTSEELSGKSYSFAKYTISGGLQPETTYTLSAWARVDQKAMDNQQHVFVGAFAGDYSWNGSLDIDASLTEKYNKATFTTPSGKEFNPALIVYLSHPNDDPSKDSISGRGYISKLKLEEGTTASPWSPNPADHEYNSWRYGLTGNVSVPYSGTVPCNQLEQGFSVQLTATGSASSLSFKIDDTEFTYSGGVASGDVFMFSGFSYTKNGLSIVSKTNKAYFILQPDKPNQITCNVPGTVRIIGFQNLYA